MLSVMEAIDPCASTPGDHTRGSNDRMKSRVNVTNLRFASPHAMASSELLGPSSHLPEQSFSESESSTSKEDKGEMIVGSGRENTDVIQMDERSGSSSMGSV